MACSLPGTHAGSSENLQSNASPPGAAISPAIDNISMPMHKALNTLQQPDA